MHECDLIIALEKFKDRLPRPWVTFAHSMGGAILLLASARGETRLKRMVLSAPMMGLYGPGASTTARR